MRDRLEPRPARGNRKGNGQVPLPDARRSKEHDVLLARDKVEALQGPAERETGELLPQGDLPGGIRLDLLGEQPGHEGRVGMVRSADLEKIGALVSRNLLRNSFREALTPSHEDVVNVPSIPRHTWVGE